MRKIDDVRRDLKKSYKRLKSWRLVGLEFGVSKAMAFRIATQRYEPKDRNIRRALGMEPIRTAPAPVCPECGEVHVTKRCVKKRGTTETRRTRRNLFDYSIKALRRMLEEREEW